MSETSAAAAVPVEGRWRLVEYGAAVAAPALAAVALARYGLGGEGLFAAGFAVVLVALSVVDIKERRLPNVIVLPSIAVAFASQALLHGDRMLEWTAAAVAAALFFFLPGLFVRGGIGMGDIKLAFLLGAMLGSAVVPALLIGTVSGAIGAAVLVFARGRDARSDGLPYGPFLAAGGLLALLTDVGAPF